MKIDRSFLRSKVARRIFILFILCALIPIAALTLLSYTQVSQQLKKQCMGRLYNSAKSHGMSIYERLLFLETNLNLIGSTAFKDTKRLSILNPEKILGDHETKRFTALALIKKTGEINQLYGELKDFSMELLNKATKNDNGKTTIIFQDNQNFSSTVYMVIKLDRNSLKSDRLLGQVETSYLWGIGYKNMLPPMTDLCLVDQFRKVLVSSFSVSDALLHRVMMKNDESKASFFQYNVGDQGFYVSYWPLFIKSGFNAPNLSVVLRRSEADAMSPIADFKKIFPLVVLLSIWIVLLLSIFHIRKSLVPLEKLKQGTLRVAKNDFKSRVAVKSDDEFEDLADSFNLMSQQLGRHFEALTTRSEIDRAILSSLSVKKIVNTALKRIYQFFSCDSISVSLVIDKKPSTYHSYILTDVRVRKTQEQFFNITSEDEQILTKNSKYLLVDLKEGRPGYLAQTAMKNMKSFLVLPLFLNRILKGTIALGFKDDTNFSQDDLNHARQIADQVTVALSNSSLVEELEKLNLGTLEALARTVDAKSTWTAGHSERVTSLSVKIAKILGLDQKQIDTLQRGAFLHDIGKIGTPLTILDKPGRLTDEEYEIIKEHPVIGARILEPIEAYADVLPIVLQHHEQYDGKGYPHGLAGEDIALSARILAVADVYDAVVSDRPYRHGWIEEKAVKMITQEAGTHFDPKVVDAFLAAIS
ncbi:MAG: HD domain-containing protein [Desulfobacula sp.]|nr:HD domain-containing protein [Desulfobacula sp.]